MTHGIRALALLTVALSCGAAGQWELQHFHDDDKSQLQLTDIRFPSARLGLAVGVLSEGNRQRPVSLVTSDGGRTWATMRAPNAGRSLFCLDESACWMAAENGVYFTSEVGRQWRRVLKQNGIVSVHFVSRDHGWAVGAEKKLLETRDGGNKWTSMPIREEIKSSDDRTVFHAVEFLSPKAGMIAGRSEPRRRIPVWMDTEPDDMREKPSLWVLLDTRDAGETWKVQTTSAFGRVTEISGAADGSAALALVEFDGLFAYPSEVHRMNLRNGDSTPVLRRKNLAITDIAVLPDGSAIAAGFEPPGILGRTPVPGKVKVLRSRDFSTWMEMPVDYRAVATRVSVSALDQANVWIATDTGMILRLVP